MINGGLRLSRVSRADLGKKQSANLMPRELEDPAINICREVNRVGICRLEIKLGLGEFHGGVLLNFLKNALNFTGSVSGEIVVANERLDGNVVVATTNLANSLGELDIIFDTKDGCDRKRIQRNEGAEVKRASYAHKLDVRFAASCRGPVDDRE